MTRPRRTTVLAALITSASFLACGPLAPAEVSVDVEPGACGAWTAVVHASSWRDTAVLRADGVDVASWPVSGELVESYTGQGAAGQEVLIEAELGDAVTTRRVALPPPEVRVSLAPVAPLRADRPGVLAVTAGGCPPEPGWRYRVLGPGDLQFEGPLSPRDQLGVPAAPEGESTWRVEVLDGETVLASSTVVLAVLGPCVDGDGDGVGVCEVPPDCDDTDPSISPNATEKAIPNGVDDDCDGVIDEGTVAFDDDGDGYSERDGDCDDADRERHPGAAELPDCRDQDCDGELDEGVTRPPADDAFEDNDSAQHAHDLETWSKRRFKTELAVVSRNAADEEWFQFFSQDGELDDWRIIVTGTRLPEGSVWDVDVTDAGGGSRGSARLTADGDQVSVTGKVFSDDSGMYRVRLKPVSLPGDYCPATFTVLSR